MKKILFWAIALRLLVSAFLFHPDIKTIAFQTSFLKEGVTNIYPYLINNRASLPLKEEFVYFPLTYFTIGGYQAIISGILGQNFSEWLRDAGSNSIVTNQNISLYLVLLKLPLLVIDLVIAFLLLNYFKNKEDGERAFNLWLLNPFTIILIYAFSNIDLYAVMLTLVAFLYIKRERLLVGAIFLGLAVSFKLYPLLFVPFLILKAKNIKERFLTVLIPASIFLATILPFWSNEFVKSALLSGLSTRIFSPSFSIGGGESLVLSLFLMSILFFFSLYSKTKTKLSNYFIVLLLIIFSFSHFHISWLLWIAPFFVVLVIQKPQLKNLLILWLVFAVSIPMFYSDRSMTISLFRIYSTWYDLLPTPYTIVQKFYDPLLLQSMLHSVLAGISILLSYKVLKGESNE